MLPLPIAVVPTRPFGTIRFARLELETFFFAQFLPEKDQFPDKRFSNNPQAQQCITLSLNKTLLEEWFSYQSRPELLCHNRQQQRLATHLDLMKAVFLVLLVCHLKWSLPPISLRCELQIGLQFLHHTSFHRYWVKGGVLQATNDTHCCAVSTKHFLNSLRTNSLQDISW